jgi:hypothetical protein
MRRLRRTGLAVLALVCSTLSAERAAAQVTETAIAFDSAGKVRSLTPAIAERLLLTPPAWPVSGEFVEARLFSISTGGFVLTVERQAGRIERYPLTPDHASALRFAVDAGMKRGDAPVAEETANVISQPARGAFVRNQMALTWAVYGPLLAALSEDAKVGTSLILLATGASYFVTSAISRKAVITRAQNHLTTDGALRGMGVAMGTMYLFTGENGDSRSFAAAGLAGALTGQVIGFDLGKRMTDSEAQATTTLSTYAAATALGLTGASGLINEVDDGRGAIGAIVAAGLAGYILGPRYPRRARYTVTKGDVLILSTGAVLGVGATAVPFIGGNFEDEQPFFAATTAGLLTGLYLVERNWVRKYDHSSQDATETWLGMGAGALMGAGIAVLAETEAQGTVGLLTGGGLIGALIAHNLIDPARAGTQLGQSSSRTSTRGRFSVNVSNLALGLARVRGAHPIVSVRF